MNFEPSDEQRMLADSVGRYVAKQGGFARWRQVVASESGRCEEDWQAYADMGLLGLNVAERYGGIGAGPLETLIVAEAFGRAMVVEPFVSTAVVAVAAFGRHATDVQRLAWLPSIADGSRRVALAALERDSRYDLHRVATTLRHDGESLRIDGRKSVVLDAPSAHSFIVSARERGAVDAEDGISLVHVDANAPGVSMTPYRTIDGRRCADLRLDAVRVTRDDVIASPENGHDALDAAVDRGIAALCAEAVGAMSALLDLTVDYLRTRRQFGQPIGRFQALQHRAADMLGALEQARSMAYVAAAHADHADAVRRRKAISAAKAVVGRHARFVGENAVQLHGGMGMTDDLAVGHYFKRLSSIDMTWGNTEHHVERYSDYLSLSTEDPR